MVSLPCNYALAPRLPKLPLFHKPRVFDTVRRAPFSGSRASPQPINAVGIDPLSSGPPEPPPPPPTPPRTLFPGGFKRPEIKVPTLVLRLSAEELLRGEDVAAAVDVAVSKRVGMVVLDSGDESGGRLYSAACILKSVVGDRAYVLIAERVDIAAAVGASGVVLSDEGIPALVARNMMTKSKSDSVYLPLVARTVPTADSAMSASSSDGADFLIMSTDRNSDAVILENSVNQHVKVPIFFSINLQGDDLLFNVASRLLQSGACGVVISLDDMKYFNEDHLNRMFSAPHEAKKFTHDGYPNCSMNVNDVRVVNNEKRRIAGFTKLDGKEIQLIETERELSDKAVAVIRKAAPMMKEVSLLVDAASRLTEPFLLVIVGEFNSGKSTVINALLGMRYLKEGVVPTTNEITLLSYSEMDANGHSRCERHPDGQFICYLSSQILKNMNVVDTPGTNVILQRQQRLTEEFVPRADLILFVLSSDRPLTESEVSFLLYVQKWKKKVVFVLNKLDLYQNTSELEEAIAFVKENTQKLLHADVPLFPVSARAALEAKLSFLGGGGENSEDALHNDPRWTKSRFYELERFLLSFLDGSTDMGKERMRLKLETPIGIADHLLASCERLVKQEFENASQQLTSINDVVNSVRDHALKMESESIAWRKQIISLIETAKARTIKHLESTLQLSNVNLISTYALRGERSGSIPATSILQNEIIGPSLSDAQRLMADYVKWLHSTNARQGKFYMEYFDKQWHALVDLKERMHSDSCELLGEGELSIKVMENFSASAAAKLFEQEIREVVLGTFGGLGAAGLSASLLTSVLPTTVEDLLALAFCSTGGFLAISNFPARRKDAIEKVRRIADNLACEIEEAMQKDLLHSADKLGHFVVAVSKPYQSAAQQRLDRLLEIQDEMANIEQKLLALKFEIQNLHLS